MFCIFVAFDEMVKDLLTTLEPYTEFMDLPPEDVPMEVVEAVNVHALKLLLQEAPRCEDLFLLDYATGK